jgi:hypothetical protein
MNQPILDQDIGEPVLDTSVYVFLDVRAVRRRYQATTMDSETQTLQINLYEESILNSDASYQIASKNDTVVHSGRLSCDIEQGWIASSGHAIKPA